MSQEVRKMCKPLKCSLFSIQNRQALEKLLKSIDEQIARENKHKLVRVLMESKDMLQKYDDKEKLYKAEIIHLLLMIEMVGKMVLMILVIIFLIILYIRLREG